MPEFTVTAGIFQRAAMRRALCAAEDARAITCWTEPAAGYFRVYSPCPALTLTDASGQAHTATHPEVPEACTRDCTHEGAPSPDDWDRVTRHTAYLGDIQTDHEGRPYRLHELTGTRYYQDGEVTDRYL